MISEQLIESLSGDSMARLRWRVMRALGIAPCSAAARSMTDSECLTYAAHMVLDMRQDRAKTENPAFDMARFAALREAEL